ncbi:MAG: hypothetical protein WBI57_06110 [Desulfobacterales bacterium]
MNEKDFEFKDVDPGIWKYEKEGDSIFGVLIHKEPRDEANELSARYYLENENGKVMVWGSAVLDDRLKLVEIGTPLRITYKGKQNNKKGREVNIFKVEEGKKIQEPSKDKPTESKPDDPAEELVV